MTVAIIESPQEEIRVVKGIIRQADGSPLVGATVRALVNGSDVTTDVLPLQS